MKVLIVSSSYTADYDLSIISEISKVYEVHYLMNIPVTGRKSTIINLSLFPLRNGIYKFNQHKFFSIDFNKIINTNNFCFIFRKTNKIFSLKNLYLQFNILKYIKRISPDIIHFNSITGIHLMLPLMFAKQKKIVTIHDPESHKGEENKKIEYAKRLYLKHSDLIIILNRHQKNILTDKYKINAKKIRNLVLGSYTILKRINSDNQLLPPKPYLLFAGRISKYKGLNIYIDSVRQLRQNGIGIEAIIAGSGSISGTEAENICKNKIILINRFLSTEELISLIRNCFLLICPYTEATQSGVIMTAAALGTPVIASNISGLKEYVLENKLGDLFSSEDSEELAQKIIDYFQNKEKYNELKNKLKIHSKSQWKNILIDYMKIIQELK